jgi:hypothetical protein
MLACDITKEKMRIKLDLLAEDNTRRILSLFAHDCFLGQLAGENLIVEQAPSIVSWSVIS